MLEENWRSIALCTEPVVPATPESSPGSFNRTSVIVEGPSCTLALYYMFFRSGSEFTYYCIMWPILLTVEAGNQQR